VDETLTPSSTRVKEQDAEELQRKIDEIERKVADGN
jgi:tetrahydromethanopterin S-methyltransferase subunit G